MTDASSTAGGDADRSSRTTRRTDTGRRARRTRRNSVALILVAAVLAPLLLQFALVDSRSEWLPAGWPRTAARLTATLATVAVAVLAYRLIKAMVLRRLRPPQARAHREYRSKEELTDAVLPAVHVVEHRTSVIWQRYYNEVIPLFTRMLVEPRYLHRLEQQFSVSRGRTSIRSRAQFVLTGADRDEVTVPTAASAPGAPAPAPGGPDAPRPRQANAVVVVPLMRLRKDALLDDLHITSADGTRLVALNRNETLGIVTECLIGLFHLAFFKVGVAGWKERQAAFGDELHRERTAFARAARRGNVRYDPAAETRSPQVRDFRRLQQLISMTETVSADAARAYFDEIADHFPDKDDKWTRRLREFCVFFGENYILAVEAPLPDGFYLSISYENSSTPAPPPGSRNDRLRTFFGLSPFRYWIPIESAQLFPSYHAELDGRAHHQYVLAQSVLTREDDEYVEIKPSDLGSDTLRIRHDAGPAFPHVHYVSSPPQVEPQQLIWEVRLAEIPPGALGPVFAMSLAVLGILVAFTFTAPLFTATDLNAPALTIALPIFALSLFGYTFDRLVRSSLLAAVSFLLNALLAVGGALILLTVPDDRFVPRTSRLLGLQYHSLLLVGSILSAMLVVFLFSAWRVLLADYTQRTRDGHDIVLGGNAEGAAR